MVQSGFFWTNKFSDIRPNNIIIRNEKTWKSALYTENFVFKVFLTKFELKLIQIEIIKT